MPRALTTATLPLLVRRYKKSEMNHFEAERSKLLDRFGKSFDGHYGWAAHILKPKTNKPIRSFADIEESVLPHLQPYISSRVTTFMQSLKGFTIDSD